MPQVRMDALFKENTERCRVNKYLLFSNDNHRLSIPKDLMLEASLWWHDVKRKIWIPFGERLEERKEEEDTIEVMIAITADTEITQIAFPDDIVRYYYEIEPFTKDYICLSISYVKSTMYNTIINDEDNKNYQYDYIAFSNIICQGGIYNTMWIRWHEWVLRRTFTIKNEK